MAAVGVPLESKGEEAEGDEIETAMSSSASRANSVGDVDSDASPNGEVQASARHQPIPPSAAKPNSVRRKGMGVRFQHQEGVPIPRSPTPAQQAQPPPWRMRKRNGLSFTLLPDSADDSADEQTTSGAETDEAGTEPGPADADGADATEESESESGGSKIMELLGKDKNRFKWMERSMANLVNQVAPPVVKKKTAQDIIATTLRRRSPSMLLTKQPIKQMAVHSQPCEPHLDMPSRLMPDPSAQASDKPEEEPQGDTRAMILNFFEKNFETFNWQPAQKAVMAQRVEAVQVTANNWEEEDFMSSFLSSSSEDEAPAPAPKVNTVWDRLYTEKKAEEKKVEEKKFEEKKSEEKKAEDAQQDARGALSDTASPDNPAPKAGSSAAPPTAAAAIATAAATAAGPLSMRNRSTSKVRQAVSAPQSPVMSTATARSWAPRPNPPISPQAAATQYQTQRVAVLTFGGSRQALRESAGPTPAAAGAAGYAPAAGASAATAACAVIAAGAATGRGYGSAGGNGSTGGGSSVDAGGGAGAGSSARVALPSPGWQGRQTPQQSPQRVTRDWAAGSRPATRGGSFAAGILGDVTSRAVGSGPAGKSDAAPPALPSTSREGGSATDGVAGPFAAAGTGRQVAAAAAATAAAAAAAAAAGTTAASRIVPPRRGAASHYDAALGLKTSLTRALSAKTSEEFCGGYNTSSNCSPSDVEKAGDSAAAGGGGGGGEDGQTGQPWALEGDILKNIKAMLADIQASNAKIIPYLPSYVADKIARVSKTAPQPLAATLSTVGSMGPSRRSRLLSTGAGGGGSAGGAPSSACASPRSGGGGAAAATAVAVAAVSLEDSSASAACATDGNSDAAAAAANAHATAPAAATEGSGSGDDGGDGDAAVQELAMDSLSKLAMELQPLHKHVMRGRQRRGSGGSITIASLSSTSSASDGADADATGGAGGVGASDFSALSAMAARIRSGRPVHRIPSGGGVVTGGGAVNSAAGESGQQEVGGGEPAGDGDAAIAAAGVSAENSGGGVAGCSGGVRAGSSGGGGAGSGAASARSSSSGAAAGGSSSRFPPIMQRPNSMQGARRSGDGAVAGSGIKRGTAAVAAIATVSYLTGVTSQCRLERRTSAYSCDSSPTWHKSPSQDSLRSRGTAPHLSGKGSDSGARRPISPMLLGTAAPVGGLSAKSAWLTGGGEASRTAFAVRSLDGTSRSINR